MTIPQFFSIMNITLLLSADIGTILASISEVESGNNDKAKSRTGDISRYQISPKVWKDYAFYEQDRKFKIFSPAQAKDSGIARIVAERIINDRRSRFQSLKGRPPTPLELYVLWHKPAQAYSGHITPKVREKAERFQNIYYLKLANQKPATTNDSGCKPIEK